MATSDRTILVTGATGNQGGTVARHLLKRGKFKVRAMVRDENKPAAIALKQLGAELTLADFNDRASLDRAVQGVYGVFSIQDFREGAAVEVQYGNAIVDAAKAANVQHFIYSSVGGAERNTGIPHFDSKFQVEEYIRSLAQPLLGTIGLPHTILRPVFFFYNYNMMLPMVKNGTLPQPLSPDTKLQQLSEEDYGKMVAEVFDRPADFMNREIEVASVEMTMLEVAAAFTRVLGKNVAYQQIPFEAFEQQAGEEITMMYRWFENVGYGADFAQLKRDFPAPTDFESYLRAHVVMPASSRV
jgi:uncharacterized protein YbjT (DUF2867 family)